MSNEADDIKGGEQDRPAGGISRREFLKYSGVAGGALLLGIPGSQVMAGSKSRVALLSTKDRKSGVGSSIKALNINPVKNKDVLIKPNFNTADPVPGSTHNDTLVALVEEVWKMGARSVSLGERSYPVTAEVMEQKGVVPLMEKLDVKIIDFDDLADKDWVKIKPKESPWEDVDVKVLPPATDAPIRVLRAEFSPSGSTISASNNPSATKLLSALPREDWGVIGKQEMTSGFDNRTP